MAKKRIRQKDLIANVAECVALKDVVLMRSDKHFDQYCWMIVGYKKRKGKWFYFVCMSGSLNQFEVPIHRVIFPKKKMYA